MFLTAFRSVPPPHRVAQRDAAAWLIGALRRSHDRRDIGHLPDLSADDRDRAVSLYQALAGRSGISHRGTWLPDFTHDRWDEMLLFGESRPTMTAGADLGRRMQYFRDVTTREMDKLFADDLAPPRRIFQVSCTGYYSPSASQHLCLHKGWLREPRLIHIGHMGCYAALPAIALAAEALGGSSAEDHNGTPTAIIFTELCSLHLRPSAASPEQVVINSLFADGIIRVDMATTPRPGALRLIGYHEELLPDTAGLMTWYPADGQFAMSLSGSVPDAIQSRIHALTSAFLDRHGTSLARVQRLAIHPGGRRIIESVGQALGASPEHIRHSQAVFRERGNMSSATLPHIWQALSEDSAVAAGEIIVAMAFGPGLTVAMALLEKV